MTRYLLILAVAAMMFAACPPRFAAGDDEAPGTALAEATYRSELCRLAQATAAMRQAALNADMDFPEPRPEVLFPMGR
ncbi:MAG: hypothetical protein RDU30_03655 [Desulfovibrionaceae bacterium]|nr:hypothetical protein [Desulfovibrionaceae bacterium]